MEPKVTGTSVAQEATRAAAALRLSDAVPLIQLTSPHSVPATPVSLWVPGLVFAAGPHSTQAMARSKY